MISSSLRRQAGRSSLTLILVAAFSAGFGLWAAQILLKDEPAPQFVALKVFPNARHLKDLTLESAEGELHVNQFKGQWLVLFFGYTHCPDVCPTALAALRETFELMPDTQHPEVLFVSVDPVRDTVEKLQQYVTFFHNDFHSATASEDILKELTRQYSSIFYLSEADENGLYNVDHTASMFVVSPHGQLYGLFSAPQDPKQLAADMTILASLDMANE